MISDNFRFWLGALQELVGTRVFTTTTSIVNRSCGVGEFLVNFTPGTDMGTSHRHFTLRFRVFVHLHRPCRNDDNLISDPARTARAEVRAVVS